MPKITPIPEMFASMVFHEAAMEQYVTPEAFAAGLLVGMAEELYQLYQKMPHDGITKLVASGNGVRKNPVLRQVIEEVFRMELTIPDHTEEAAYGAAMFAAEAN